MGLVGILRRERGDPPPSNGRWVGGLFLLQVDRVGGGSVNMAVGRAIGGRLVGWAGMTGLIVAARRASMSRIDIANISAGNTGVAF